MSPVLPGLGASGSLNINRALVIDTTAPIVAGAVTDGTYYNSTTSSPNLTWAAGTDTGGSGIAKYQVAIGTSSGGTQSLTWTDIGNVTTYQVTSGITLVAGSTYYASIRAVDAAGNASTPILGDGWIVDTTPPTSPTVNDGGDSYNSTQTNLVTWTASTDAASGLAKYEFAIGTTAGGTEVLTWTDVALVTSYRSTGLALSVGTTYYVSVRASDVAGNSTIAQGDGWTIVACDTYGWCPQAYIKAPNAEAGDYFGGGLWFYNGSMAISGDTLVVGVTAENSNQTTITNGTTASSDSSAPSAGAAYVFKRTGTTWAQEAYIKAPNAEASDNFGVSVAIHGDTISVGALLEDSNQTTITNGTTASANNTAGSSGAAYVFKRTGTSWAQEAYLKCSNNTGNNNFGNSVAVHGDTVVVGAYESGSDSGSACVFKRTGIIWAQEAILTAVNAGNNDNFGTNLAIHGDTILVGAPGEDSNQTTITNGTTASADNSAASAGAAYVFKRTGVNWAQEAYLKASNAEALDYFGKLVEISGDTVVVAACHESSNQTTITNGTTASGDNSAAYAGAVYVFKRTGVNWAQEAYIKAANAEANDAFGCGLFGGYVHGISIHADTIVVGAPGEDSSQTTITNGATASSDNSASAAGAVYVYKRTGTNWAQEAYVKASNAKAGDGFGSGVSIQNDTLVVGAWAERSNQTTITNGTTASSDSSITDAGAVYVFKRTGVTWAQEAYIKAPNVGTQDRFGEIVGISGDTILSAARGEDSNQTTITNGTTASSDNSVTNTGAVYIFKR